MRSTFLVLMGAVVASPGCLSKGEAPPIRYFQPPLSASSKPDPGYPPSTESEPQLMIRVDASQHLGESMVWQDDGVEVGFYADRRWILPPARFLEDALRNELVGARRFRQSVGSRAARLDAVLLAFDEERRPEHAAIVRVRAEYRAAGSDLVMLRMASARIALETDDPIELARAMASGLEQIARELGDWIVAGPGQ